MTSDLKKLLSKNCVGSGLITQDSNGEVLCLSLVNQLPSVSCQSHCQFQTVQKEYAFFIIASQ